MAAGLVQGSILVGFQALLLEAGARAGIGQAELRGCLMSSAQVTMLVASTLWARWYAVCVRTKKPRRFFLGIAVVRAVQLAAATLAARLPPSLPSDTAEKPGSAPEQRGTQ
mmetsp:Transcript_113183/g.315141  ORF Transcript_113183/g.315141 Transcript_113183/m.315141 type:complete len:111 (-) Transcript_113183:94-426(-)